ncbi:MAG: hypothetical protein GY883_25030 [Shimia sp.]|nr:hypothetical protein [Shimia sp.]
MRFVFLSSLCFATALSACATSNLPVRSTPQAEHPVTGRVTSPIPDITSAMPGSGETLAGVSAQEFGQAVFPGAGKNSDLSPAVEAFQKTCLTHSPNVSAIAQTASSLGYEVERMPGNAVFAMKEGANGASSIRVNMQSDYAYECAVTALSAQGLNAAQIRDGFFASVGRPHANGTGEITLNGKVYTLRHQTISGGGFGFDEQAFLLQAD